MCIAHTYTKFLNNYKNCAVPSVIVVSVRVNDGDFPSLSHPQHCILGACLLRERASDAAIWERAMQQNMRVIVSVLMLSLMRRRQVTLPFSLLAPPHTHTDITFMQLLALVYELSRALSALWALPIDTEQRVQCVRFVVRIVTRVQCLSKSQK